MAHDVQQSITEYDYFWKQPKLFSLGTQEQCSLQRLQREESNYH